MNVDLTNRRWKSQHIQRNELALDPRILEKTFGPELQYSDVVSTGARCSFGIAPGGVCMLLLGAGVSQETLMVRQKAALT